MGRNLCSLAGKSRRYQPGPNGLRMISALMVLRERILEPLIRGVVNTAPSAPTTNATSLDQHYRILREQMHEICRELGLAA